MAKPSPLQILIEYAQHQRDLRSRALSTALGSETSAAARLRLLTDYRRDYLLSYREATERGVSTHALVNYQDFLTKLDRAIGQQETACTITRTEVSNARTELIRSEKRRHSLDILNQRRVTAARRLDDRRERQANDEIAARIARQAPRRDR